MTTESEPQPHLAKVAYADAKRLASEGAYAQALERHLWFHEHALTHEPAFYGVRLSFALGAWRELGAKYPPALDALRGIRDRNTVRLLDGDPSDELFHDVVALNSTLGDDEATFRLFRHIEATDPELARRRFRCMADEAFNHAPELFVRYTPDLERYFDSVCEMHLQVRQSFAKAVASVGPNHTQILEACVHVQGMKDGFGQSVQKLTGMAEAGGQLELARRMLERANEVMLEADSV